jgi:hypothetical protein
MEMATANATVIAEPNFYIHVNDVIVSILKILIFDNLNFEKSQLLERTVSLFGKFPIPTVFHYSGHETFCLMTVPSAL